MYKGLGKPLAKKKAFLTPFRPPSSVPTTERAARDNLELPLISDQAAHLAPSTVPALKSVAGGSDRASNGHASLLLNLR